MSERANVLVTRPIMEGPTRVLQERCDVTIHENEFGIPRDELLKVVAGRDAIITMLTEKVDAEFLDERRTAAEDRGEPRRGVRQHRRRGVHRRRRAGDEHARRPDRDHGRHRVRAADGGRAPRRRGRAVPPRAHPVDLGAADDARPGRAPQDDRHRRLRTHRAGGRAPREGVRDARGLQRRVPAPARRRGGDRRPTARARRPARRSGLRLDPHEPHARDAPSVRRGGVRADEADGRPGEHVARPGGRRGGARRRARGRGDLRRGTRRVRTRARGRRTAARARERGGDPASGERHRGHA